MKIKCENNFNVGDSVDILLHRIPADRKEYTTGKLAICSHHQKSVVIDRVLIDANFGNVDYVVSVTYEDDTNEMLLLPQSALEAAAKENTPSHGSYPVPPKANIGERVGIIPNSTTKLDTQKHVEELTVKAIDYSHETCSFTYTVEDESGKTKVIPERPNDDTYVENMSYIYELLNDLRKAESRVIESGVKMITYDYTPFHPYHNSGKVIKTEEIYTQNGEEYAAYIDAQSGKKLATLLSEVTPLVNNAPKFEEGQMVCIRASYAHTHNKYKILSIYAPNKDDDQQYAVKVDGLPEGTFILERDLMLVPKTVKVKKKASK